MNSINCDHIVGIEKTRQVNCDVTHYTQSQSELFMAQYDAKTFVKHTYCLNCGEKIDWKRIEGGAK
jgi:hypothetical protein